MVRRKQINSMKKKLLLPLSLLLALFYANAAVHTVNSGNFYYSPSALTVAQGDTVIWVNDGGFHNVNFDLNTITSVSFGNPENFQSTATSDDTLYQHTFNFTGDYSYDCSVGPHAANGMTGTLNVIASSSVNDANKLNTAFSFYPNPAENVIQFPYFDKIDQVAIFSVTGQKVLETRTVKQQLNLSGLSTGVYMIKIISNDASKTTKLVIK
jgi:plastocyanin